MPEPKQKLIKACLSAEGDGLQYTGSEGYKDIQDNPLLLVAPSIQSSKEAYGALWKSTLVPVKLSLLGGNRIETNLRKVQLENMLDNSTIIKLQSNISILDTVYKTNMLY